MNPEAARAGGTSIVLWTPCEYENWKSANYRLVAIKLMDAGTWCHRYIDLRKKAALWFYSESIP